MGMLSLEHYCFSYFNHRYHFHVGSSTSLALAKLTGVALNTIRGDRNLPFLPAFDKTRPMSR